MARPTKLSFTLLALELAASVTAVVLFGLAYPDRFRSKLWSNGGVEGWNSNPNLRIYFYANHVEPPEIPLIWSQRLTDSNLAIAILSFVIFFARTVMAHLDYLPRYATVLYDTLLAILWIVSVSGQASGDFSDPDHPSAHAWYLTRGCAESWTGTRSYCHVAQASFAISILAALLYCGRLLREAMLVAYHRGRKHERKWTVVDAVDMEDLEEEKYSDVELESEGRLTVREPRYDPGLSPVLAFFPSGPN
ncbi:hypothetical protein B0J13DRAFT_104470 [Dactylonectria estremocensis]|uniref:MARVEL domain-containing protein n=1 Tax=Dactylonectria estremocensis TaxID=1079267 RepID=A0A9P9IQI5_9HYPO|nr:hypothetical protein B0J13DRAFT_104470 [Dactylonectria estremocensis]